MEIILLMFVLIKLPIIEKCFEELIFHKVDLTGIILKPNMILAKMHQKTKFQMKSFT